jgi:hypothetical protein
MATVGNWNRLDAAYTSQTFGRDGVAGGVAVAGFHKSLRRGGQWHIIAAYGGGQVNGTCEKYGFGHPK